MGTPELSERLALLRLASVDIGELSQLIADEAVRLLGGEQAVVWIHRHSVGRLFVEQTSHEIRSVDLGTAEAERLLDGEPTLLTQPLDGAEYQLVEASFGVAAAERPQQVLLLPLRAGDTAVGVLVVDGYNRQDADRRATHEALAGQAGSLLANHEALARSRGHEAQLEALYQTAGEVSAKLDTETVLSAIVERARQLVGTPISYITLVDSARGQLRMRSAVGVEHPEFDQIRLRIGTGLGGMAAKEEQAFYTSDYLNDARFTHSPSVDAAVRAEGIKSILGVPMRASTEFVGVLYAADRGVRVFSDADVEILLNLARHAALAIDNAALYERATTALEEVRSVNEVVKRQNSLLERAGDAHRRFSEVMLASGGLAEITALVADLNQGHVVVLDPRLRPLQAAGEVDEPFGRTLAVDGLAAADADAGVQEALHGLFQPGSVVVDPSPPSRVRTWVAAPVIARAEVLGSVWAACDGERLDEERGLIEEAARAVALELLKERSLAEVERRLGRELLDELLAERPVLAEALERRAAELGVDLTRPHRLAVASLDAGQGGREELRSVREEITDRLKGSELCSFVADYGGRLVALVSPGEGGESRRALARLVAPLPAVRIVLSPACTQRSEYRRQFLACERTLSLLAERLTMPVIDLEETRVLALLLRRGDGEDVRAFVDDALGELVRHDREHGSHLVATLDAYFQAGSSPRRAAAALHVHVNTVYYRLERIKELIGADFAVPRRALDLQVALLARLLLGDLDAESSAGARVLDAADIDGAKTLP